MTMRAEYKAKREILRQRTLYFLFEGLPGWLVVMLTFGSLIISVVSLRETRSAQREIYVLKQTIEQTAALVRDTRGGSRAGEP